MSSQNLRTHRSGMLLLLLFLSSLFISARSETTEISFPPFPVNDSTMQRYGDIQFNAENNSIVMNLKSVAMATGTCAYLMYDGKSNPQIQQVSAAGTVSSFTTSFTFKFTTSPNQQVWDVNSTNTTVATALAFVLTTTPMDPSDAIQTTAARATWAGQPGACKSYTQADTNYYYTQGKSDYLGVVFNNGNSFNKGEPSSNFIGIIDGLSASGFKPGSTYNLCGNQTHCSYLSTGGGFTAWIDFTPQRTLQVRLMNGSHPHNQKPPLHLLEYPYIGLPIAKGNYLLLTFLGSSAENHIQSHELSSWSFYSSGIPETISSPKKKWVAPVFGAIGALALLLVVGFLSLWFTKNRRSVPFSYSSGPRVFLYKELRIATKNFSENEKLGSGGFGTVYRGSIESSDTGSQTLVAVKRINYDSKHAETTFLAEISSLTQIRHGNVVQLHGWCHEKGRLLLVYDYMPNRGLNEWLHDSSGNNCKRRRELPLRVRHGILQGVAAALEYLHKDCPQCVLHRDIKSSNVMLDADLKAHLGDFGLARLMDHQQLDKTTNAAGTIGYMAPEMPHTGKATKESDVYSFGILVLEVVCGRRPLDLKAQEPEDMSLLHSVWRAHEARRILGVADGRLLQTRQPFGLMEPHKDDPTIHCAMHIQPNSSNAEILDVAMNVPDIGTVEVNEVQVEKMLITNLLHVGLLCCLPNPRARPTMGEVIHILQEIGDIDSEDYAMANINMPRVPDTKPLGLYCCLEYSQILESL